MECDAVNVVKTFPDNENNESVNNNSSALKKQCSMTIFGLSEESQEEISHELFEKMES
jgi:hypothetical protein